MADRNQQACSPDLKFHQKSNFSIDHFHQFFRQQTEQLLEQINCLHEFSLVGGERQDALEHVLGGITELSNQVADAVDHISPYDKRTFSEGIKNLEETLRLTQSKTTPNSKFQFRSKYKRDLPLSTKSPEKSSPTEPTQDPAQKLEGPSTNKCSLATTVPSITRSPDEKDIVDNLPLISKNYNEEITKPSAGVRIPSFSQATKIEITNYQDMHILLPPSASRATSAGTVTKLSRSIVDMSIPTTIQTPFASLVLKDIKNSLIIAGQVAGAAHITGVVDSIIAIAARQVRIHDCANLKTYVYCASRPIIENCKNIQFSPLPKCYMSSSQELSVNQWDQVDDFSWQKTEHSPYWNIIPEEERLVERIWTDIVPGEFGVGLTEILEQLGLK